MKNLVKVIDLQASQRWALNGGPFGSKLGSKDYVSNGVPVIRGKNLSGRTKFSLDEFVYVSEEKADELRANNAHPGDLVFTQRGTLGQVGLIPDDSPFKRYVISQSQMKLTVDETKASPLFLYYYFTSKKAVQDIHNLAFSAGVPHINLGILRAYRVPLPDLPTQRKSAGILSAYDDLIENNLRRIKILEEMALSLYREWFVHFRFPGHEFVNTVDSALGQIPEGWEVKKLGDECELTMGQSPKSKYYNDRGEGTPFHQGVTNFGDHFPTDRLSCTVENRIAEKGDILFSVRAPVGRINVANKRIVIGRGVSAIRHANGSQNFLLFQLYHLFQEEDSMGNGAIFKAVTKSDMQNIELIVPSSELVTGFESAGVPFFAEIKNLTDRNHTLRQTRDLLLPKLLTQS